MRPTGEPGPSPSALQQATKTTVRGVGYTAGAAFILMFWVIPGVVTVWMILDWLWGLLGF